MHSPNRKAIVNSAIHLIEGLIFFAAIMLLITSCKSSQPRENMQYATVTDTLPDGNLLSYPVLLSEEYLSSLRPLPPGVTVVTASESLRRAENKPKRSGVNIGLINVTRRGDTEVSGDGNDLDLVNKINKQDNETVNGNQVKSDIGDSGGFVLPDLEWWQWIAGIAVFIILAVLIIKYVI